MKQGKIPEQYADKIVTEVMESINLMENKFIAEHEDVKLSYVDELFDGVLFNVMKDYIRAEL